VNINSFEYMIKSYGIKKFEVSTNTRKIGTIIIRIFQYVNIKEFKKYLTSLIPITINIEIDDVFRNRLKRWANETNDSE